MSLASFCVTLKYKSNYILDPSAYTILDFLDFETFFLKEDLEEGKYFNVKPHQEVCMARLEDVSHTVTQESNTYYQNFFIIYFVIDGAIEKTNQLTQITLERNYLFFTQPGQLNSWKEIKKASGYVLAFTKDFIVRRLTDKKYMRKLDFLDTRVVPKFHLEQEVSDYYQQRFDIALEDYRSTEGDEFIHLWIMELLLRTQKECHLGSLSNLLNRNRSRAMKISEDFKEKIEDHYIEGHKQNFIASKRVADYANDLNINANYLNNMVKEAYGKKASDLIFERTLLAAQSKLIHTNKTISEIAFFLDFNSPSYFVRFFKDRAQMTPNQYRNRIGKFLK
ncbi:helix-turn-helix domain-containing protein [Aquimarina celericrescens]|uniref:Helix-turn-helix domain-containing protein n=1 Tax=Aquimarina celericrescens TaxID=1964542 RepID=A0ABW5AUI0_9FLAO|nr:AraC family transcriptional regulator [Aquimarina celericrescens]